MNVEQPAAQSDAGPWILWVDGVGGFLVCAGETATLGQAFADPPADVPLLADVSRRHATVRRDAEGYWLEADRPTSVNNQPVTRALLKSGDRIALGESCQLLFGRPEPLSATARLVPVSGHRFGCPVDAVLLMAETVVLGPSSQAHIHVPDLSDRVVIYRQAAGAQGPVLAVRSSRSMRVSGKTLRERAPLNTGESVTVEDVTMTLEAWSG